MKSTMRPGTGTAVPSRCNADSCELTLELGVLSKATAAALIATGLLSVLLFPLGALSLLRRAQPSPAGSQPTATGHQVQAES